MYTNEMTWDQWASVLTNKGKSGITLIDEMLIPYKKWYSFSYGKTDAQIAVALGKTEADIVKLKYGFSALKDFYDAMNNVAVVARDRKADLIEFVDVR